MHAADETNTNRFRKIVVDSVVFSLPSIGFFLQCFPARCGGVDWFYCTTLLRSCVETSRVPRTLTEWSFRLHEGPASRLAGPPFFDEADGVALLAHVVDSPTPTDARNNFWTSTCCYLTVLPTPWLVCSHRRRHVLLLQHWGLGQRRPRTR